MILLIKNLILKIIFIKPKFNNDNEIKNFIENLFTEHTLNKVIYLRYKLNDKGQILVDDLANYNALKKIMLILIKLLIY